MGSPSLLQKVSVFSLSPPHLAKAPKVQGGGFPWEFLCLGRAALPIRLILGWDLANTTAPESVGSFGVAAPGRSSSSPLFAA